MRVSPVCLPTALWVLASCVCAAQTIADPITPELEGYLKPLQLDESAYGCGPLLEPGRTLYVAVDGDDAADGLSPETAWRTINRGLRNLAAGDTLLIGDGEYREPSMQPNAAGEPGRPIRIMAQPKARVIVNCGKLVGPFSPSADLPHVYQAPLTEMEFPDVWEADSLVTLQDAACRDRLTELPGTYLFDPQAGAIFVHFSDGRSGEGRFVEVRRSFRGIELNTAYVHLQGIWFKHGWEAVLIRRGHHNTVEDCAFFANSQHGLCVRVEAHHNLLKNNYGFGNPMRGTILMSGNAGENLFLGNRCDPSRPTVRTRGSDYHYAMNNYSGDAGPANLIIGNFLNDTLSFRWKPPVKQTVFEGNIAVGSVYSQKARWAERTPADRMVIRDNVILGHVSWEGGLGHEDGNGAWLDEDKVFVNNYHADGDAEAVAAARFADPAYLDYRLQSDSPLIGAGPGGIDVGAYPSQTGRILYVGPAGDDANPGTSERLALRTLAAAAGALQLGDTLYVMSGEYPEALAIAASGTADAPITVRAYHRERVALPGLVLDGASIHVEGFTISGAPGDGVLVTGADTTLRRLLVSGCPGAGVRARGAAGLTAEHCTLAGSRVGIALDDGATGAELRSCVIARNADAQITADDDARAGSRAYNCCISGAGDASVPLATLIDCIATDPGFVDAAHGDYRLAWDSPARYLGEFSRAAGSESALERTAELSDIRAAAQAETAVIRWQTPDFDTTGAVRYRRAGNGPWLRAEDTEQGSIHAIGIGGLAPATEYEFAVDVDNRRGPGASSPPGAFTTAATSRAPATLYVAPTGDDSADGLTPQSAWQTIRQACFCVQPGDTVLVAPGEYRHPIAPIISGRPDRRITFRAHGDDEAIINGMAVLDALVSLKDKHNVTVEGFCLDTGSSGWFIAPNLVELADCEDVEILNCRRHMPAGAAVADNAEEFWASAGVEAIGCKNLRIEGNVIWAARYPLRVFGCENVLVKNNTFADKSVVTIQIGDTGLGARGLRFVNNLLYESRSFRNSFFWINQESEYVIDHNLYYATDPSLGLAAIRGTGADPVAAAADLAQWQQISGQEAHSLQADPMFVSAEDRDYRLRPGSPAIGAGEGGAAIGALGVAEDAPAANQ